VATVNEHQHPRDKDIESIKKIYAAQWRGHSHSSTFSNMIKQGMYSTMGNIIMLEVSASK